MNSALSYLNLRMDVSIIIVNWNTKDLLINCINSVYQTTKNLAVEIWVVDNGSSDESVKTVRDLFPEINIIENQDNLGFAKACNQALEQIKGRYAVLLNTDTILSDGTIETVADFMDKNVKVGICGGQLPNDDGSKQNSIANIPNLSTELFSKSLLRRFFPKKYPGKEQDITNPVEVESVIGAFMAVRKEAVDETGLMDESYFFFFEETDWCVRMKRSGWSVFHHPDIKVYHLQGQTAKKVHIGARIEYWRSRYIFFKKHYGMITLIILKTGLMFKLFLSLASNLILSLITAFTNKKAAERSKLYITILCWHCLGLSKVYGLRGRQGG